MLISRLFNELNQLKHLNHHLDVNIISLDENREKEEHRLSG